MSHPLPGQPPMPDHEALREERLLEVVLREQQRETAEVDADGFYHGWTTGTGHAIDDEVPDNAHWKG